MRKTIVVVGVMIALGVYVGTSAQTNIEFLVESGALVVGSGDTGDVMVVTGRSLGVRTVGVCGTGPGEQYNVQFAVALDPRERGRTARQTQLIPITPNVALSPGTRLTNLTVLNTCTDGSESFDKVRGWIE